MKVTYTQLKGKQEAGYGVTRWANAQEINQSLKELTDQPIYSVTEEAYKDICTNYYDKQCAKSKAITAEAKKYIPGGVQHNLAFNKPFPMCIVKAEGAYMYDLDGNKYIDFLQAGGPTILGSNYPAIQEEAIKLIKDCGPVTGLFHEAELLIAKEIHECMPNVEKFRMLGSGTESVMGAIRVARCATKNKRVIKIGGARHQGARHQTVPRVLRHPQRHLLRHRRSASQRSQDAGRLSQIQPDARRHRGGHR